MQERARSLLKESIKAGRISAFHIDLQEGCYNDPDINLSECFEAARNFAKNLRGHGVENNWIILLDEQKQYEDPDIYNFPKPYNDFKPDLKGSDDLYHVDAASNEMVLPKYDQDLFDPGQHYDATRFLTETSLFSGIHYDMCLSSSICGAFKAAFEAKKPLNAIIAIDATDHNTSEAAYLHKLQDEIKSAVPNINLDSNTYNVSCAQTSEIVECLHSFSRG